MSDSLEAFIPVPLMPDAEHQACNYPFNALEPLDSDGVLGTPFSAWQTARGHAPGTSFKIRARWRGNPRDRRVAGFEVKINLSCATGHNVVLMNGVPAAAELMFLQVKCWLKERGCTSLGLDKMDLESVVLESVTPTYLHRLADKQEAKAARDEFRAATQVRNVPRSQGKSRRKRAFSIGDGTDDTVYLKDRETPLAGYVKDRASEVEQVFPSKQLRGSIFDEGERYLRVEPKLNGVWLRKHKRTRIEDWRMYGQDTAYREAYAVVRARLRLDDGLRARKPKEPDILRLAPLDQEVLRWHLDDDEAHLARDHPAFLAKANKIARQQYFSAMKLRIWRKLRVDISIPWHVQAKAASPRLNALLHYPGMYDPPEHLVSRVFDPPMAARLIHELKVKVDAGRPRSIGRTHVPPSQREPAMVPLGQIVVETDARAFLDRIGKPLHPFLRAHRCGVFGDVSKEDVLALTRAAADGMPVRSRYKVGDDWLTVSTEYVAQNRGARQAVTTVRHCPGEPMGRPSM